MKIYPVQKIDENTLQIKEKHTKKNEMNTLN